jgi:hypothetical protein
MGYGQGWAPPSSPGGGGGGVGTAGPIATGATTTIGTGAYTALASDTYIRCNGGALGNPTTITLPTVASGLRAGQRIAICSFDLSGNLVTILPAAGDNIVGGTAYNLGNYGEVVEFQCRIAGTVANWLMTSRYVHPIFTFPIQPTLAAGAQGPLSMGWVQIPQGPVYVFAIAISHDAALTGGVSTFSLNGLSTTPHTQTITSPAKDTMFVVSPGNAGWLTVPGASAGASVQLTISTNAAFAGPTTAFASLLLW